MDMAREKLLIVDDEEDILDLVRHHLNREGYEVHVAASGEQALQLARSRHFHLMVLDLMLPGMDGLEVARQLNGDARTRALPIVMLTAKGEEADVVAGLELGADDYVTKPFSPRILVARIRAVIRRRGLATPDENALLDIHGISIHPGRREVTVAGQPVDLTYTEFQVLSLLARRPGWVFTRSQIVDLVRGDDYPVTDRSVDVQIVGLRRKLGEYGKLVETVRGVGYRMRERP
jgi:two-component system phosphate regulon response regulator PhoB